MFTHFKPISPTKEFKQDLNNINFRWRDEESKMVSTYEEGPPSLLPFLELGVNLSES